MKNITGSAIGKPCLAGRDKARDKKKNASLPGSPTLRAGAFACVHRIGRGLWGGVSAAQWGDWEWQLQNRVRSLEKLALVINTPVESLAACGPVTKTYPIAVTPYYLSLMDAAEECDPLRRQCFPDPRELDCSLGEDDDPLGEERAMPVPGLIHRYPDRCLVIVTNVCAVYCRHCNRKRIWCNERPGGVREWIQPMIDHIARTPSLREVILSGGDPLLLSEGVLDWLLGTLRAIPHVEVLRIGSRAPVTLPMRVTPGLAAMLKRHRPLWFNTQFNHPREITPESTRACERLLMAGIPVSNQSVLLKGINDDYATMRDLLIGLERISVRPYYLFQCDPVRGVNHFRADIRGGMEIMEALRHNVSGLALPRYVLDCPGGRGKIPLQHFFNSACERGWDK
ncbi:MAG TPA: lysine 2,3-aminomutase [Syntrophus sp. (in: bacteria)]|nr:lysine 2,3-aminomutase [Syntrophus sp. (in: bacteria)]